MTRFMIQREDGRFWTGQTWAMDALDGERWTYRNLPEVVAPALINLYHEYCKVVTVKFTVEVCSD